MADVFWTWCLQLTRNFSTLYLYIYLVFFLCLSFSSVEFVVLIECNPNASNEAGGQ